MGFTRDLYDGETHLNIVRSWKVGVPLSVVAVVVSALAIGYFGLNLGIDFEGGTSWELPANGVSVAEVRDTLDPLGAANAKIQIVGDDTLRVSTGIEADTVTGETEDQVTAVLVETTGSADGDVRFSRVAGTWTVPAGDTPAETIQAALTDAGIEGAVVQVTDGVVRVQAASNIVEVTNALAELTGSEPSDVSVSNVGPSWGETVTDQAVRALVLFLILISIYLAVRLEWKMSLGALASVIHDVLVTVGIYAVFQFEATPATVISFLTILGYSLYDTIVVFDKVRENAPRTTTAGRMTYTEMMNMSLNQVFPRSVNTTVSAIIPVACLLIIGSWLMGAATLQEFSLALLIGLLVGAYSSLFIACPLLTWMKEREPRNRQVRERLAARADAMADSPIDEPIGTEAVGAVAAAPSAAPGQSTAPGNWSGNHPPRPRKKRKR
jgi:preprotein translocase subunit SecF